MYTELTPWDRGLESVQQLAGDDDLLDLRGALEELGDTLVAVDPLDGVLLHVAVTAVDLQGGVHHLVGGLLAMAACLVKGTPCSFRSAA